MYQQTAKSGGLWLLLMGGLLFGACTNGGGLGQEGASPIITAGPPITPFTIQSSVQAIGGPLAQGRVGDQLLANDQIRVVIQQPGKYPGVGSFGGHLIDADRIRSGSVGNDHFGVMLPLINIEWTVNGTNMFAVAAFDPATFDPEQLAKEQTMERPGSSAPQILVMQGVIDTYDYLDIDFLEPLAKALTNQALHYSSRFDDMNEPFNIYDLKDLAIDVTTAYQLDPGSRAVKITTTLINNGDAPVQLPVGDFINGSGEVQLLIPGQGFTPPLMQQIAGDTPAVIYAGSPGIDVSYGYFYELGEFTETSGETTKRAITTSLTYSGVTGVLLGEEFMKLFPLGGGKNTSVHFAVPPHGRRTFTRYFVVGDGSAGSVLDEGLRVLKVPTRTIQGRVVDASGAGIADATVAVLNDKGATVVTYRTDTSGGFRGSVATGATEVAAAFGSGTYTLRVEKPGYHLAGTDRAGACTPETITVKDTEAPEVTCTLGASGIVAFAGAVIDAATGAPIPARITIVGADPSPDRAAPGLFTDQVIFARPTGIVDLFYLGADGTIDLRGDNTIRLEPGYYLLTVTHGPEYSMATIPLTVTGYGITTIPRVVLQRVVTTPGFISADFHIHALPSPDSAVSTTHRALAAAAEGLEVLHSSDHDFLFDYGPVVRDLEAKGHLIPGTMTTIVGDEISPNNLGHIHAFPLQIDPSRPNGGALDWSLSSRDIVGPDPDFVQTVQEIVDAIKQAPGGEKVIQVNHISERATSLFVITGLVTTMAYRDTHKVEPLSTYVDPVAIRLPAPLVGDLPLPWGTSGTTTPDFSAAELAIGSDLNTNLLRESALPQWFNLLNLGYIVTATSDSDSHTPISVPLGLPRNYVASSLDPNDGMGNDLRVLDEDAYAKAINQHRVVVSAGPFIRMEASDASAGTVGIGGLLRSHHPTLRIEVTAPDWAWFDTIEIYANAIPTPIDDDGVGLMQGVAEDPAHFHAPYHIPRFVYDAAHVFRLADGTLKEWRREGGVIHAVVETPLEVERDTWVVAFVRGTAGTPGYRPLFPYTTSGRGGDDAKLTWPAQFTLDDIAADPLFNVPAWAFTNPIFIDVDGDTNNDGHPFEAIYVKQGLSPIAPHVHTDKVWH